MVGGEAERAADQAHRRVFELGDQPEARRHAPDPGPLPGTLRFYSLVKTPSTRRKPKVYISYFGEKFVVDPKGEYVWYSPLPGCADMRKNHFSPRWHRRDYIISCESERHFGPCRFYRKVK